GAVPLAMDRESRMRRAAEMGFNTETWHGTVNPDIREFAPNTHSGTREAARDRLSDEHLLERGGERLGIPDDEIPYKDRYNRTAIGVGETIYPLRLRGNYARWSDMDE